MFKKLSIRNKITLLIGLLVFLAVVLIHTASYFIGGKLASDFIEDKLSSGAMEQSKTIDNWVGELQKHVDYAAALSDKQLTSDAAPQGMATQETDPFAAMAAEHVWRQ